ncbi:hypothetical protein GCM10008106_11860 [Mongoliitalea lutea]|uniref:Uncharacterized protein n=1 Tax=Mongoliitalea lutea TaxID=849756 RepID=A0A8J3G4Y6_9BACT|nr:hypothetical protein GCM10008106_11860 [Mongoliitalea lutea]
MTWQHTPPSPISGSGTDSCPLAVLKPNPNEMAKMEENNNLRIIVNGLMK